MDLKGDQRFKETVYLDSLTGLYNRYYLSKALPEIIQNAQNSRSNLGILMLDLDNFKNINDTHGHLKGDAVLKEVAKILNGCIRGGDVAIRYAGDEFIVIFSGRGGESSSIDSFKIAAARIIEKFSRAPLKIEEAEFLVRFSAGLAIFPQDGEIPEALIDAADKALYLSKEKGKNMLSLAEEVKLRVISEQEFSRLFPSVKFINRSQETEKMKKVLRDLENNKTGFVLLKGRQGIGKSRLLDEFKKNIDAQQIFSVKVSAYEKYALMPYYVLCEALGSFFEKEKSLLSVLSASLSQEEVVSLSSVLPVFKQFITEAPQRISGEQGQLLFKAFRNIFVQLSSGKGLFFYLDNIQWLDKATFELMNYLFNYEFVRKIIVCGALDEKQLKDGSSCNEFLSSPKEKINYVLMEIPPFSLDEMKELMVSIFPDLNISAELYQYVFDITEGVPLFIEEMLKYLVESEIVIFRENKWQVLNFHKEDIPSTLEEILQRRFRKLDPETKDMLAKAVVMGKDFESELLAETVKKDQGYLFELLDRAKKKSFVGAQDSVDKFSFVSEMLQKSLYDQMRSPDRTQLHQDVIRALQSINKEESGGVLGDLAYHFEKSGNTSKFREYRDKILRESQDLFNPDDLENYLQAIEAEEDGLDIPSEVRMEKIESEISDAAIEKLADLIKYIFASVKNIGLYPAANKIREASVEKVHEALKEIMSGLKSLTFNEVEKILLVNSKRLKYHQEKMMAIDDFIAMMIDRDIKGIQILSAVEKKDLSLFLEILALNPQELRGGLVAKLIKEKGVKNIKLEAASYKRIAAQERYKPIHERMNRIVLMDLLSGKPRAGEKDLDNFIRTVKQEPQAMAANLMEVAKSLVPQDKKESGFKEQATIVSEGIQKISSELFSRQDPDSQRDLNKLISCLDDRIKSYLFMQQDLPAYKEMAKSLSEREILELILAAKKLPQEESLVSMRELYNKFISSSDKSDNLTAVLTEKLKKEGLAQSEISFVTQKSYESLSLEDRVETIAKLPTQAYDSLGKDNIQNLIKELISNSEKENLEVLIRRFLSEYESKDAGAKEEVLKYLEVFLSSLAKDSAEFDFLVIEIISSLLKAMPAVDFSVNPSFLRNIELAIKWAYEGIFHALADERWIIHNRLEQLDKIIGALSEILESKEDDQAIKEKKNFILNLFQKNLSNSTLIEALVIELKDPFLDYNKIIAKQIQRLGRQSLSNFLSKILENNDFSWEGHLYRGKVADLLRNIGEEAIEEVKVSLLSEKNSQRLRQLIEIAGLLKREDLLTLLKNSTDSQDYDVREATVFALGNIAGAAAKQILSEMAKDKDLRISRLAKREIGV